jgi:plasmid replication initiation protein
MESKATITKSNSLITASYKMSLNEIRLIYAVLAEADQYNLLSSQIYYTVSASQWEKLFNVQKDICYSEMRMAVNKLFHQSVIIHQCLENEESEETRIIQSKKVSKGSGQVGVMFTEKICGYLSDLRSHFTLLALNDIAKLQSAYHVRIYELLMSTKYRGANKFYRMEDLYEWLQPPNTMRRTDNFQRCILMEAQKAFRDHLSFTFSYEAVKEGRKITGFNFTIQEVKVKKKRPKSIDRSELDKMAVVPSFKIA